MTLWATERVCVPQQMDWPGSASMPEQGTLASMVSGSPVDLHPNSLSYPDARMESYRADSGRSAHPPNSLTSDTTGHSITDDSTNAAVFTCVEEPGDVEAP